MPVFNVFFKVVKKNLPSIIIYLFIFLILSILMTNVAGSTTDTGVFQETTLPVAVIDRDNSAVGTALSRFLSEHHKIVELSDDREEMQDELFYRNVEYILIIPEGFEADFLSAKETSVENIKVPDSSSGYFLDMQIDQYLTLIMTHSSTGASVEDAIAAAEADIENRVSVELTSEVSGESGQEPVYYYFQYMPYVLCAILISGMCPIFMALNSHDLKKRNTCSSLKLRAQNFQLALGCAIFSILCWLLFVLCALIIYRGNFFQSGILLCLANSLAFTIVSACISFLVGMLAKNQNVLSAINNTVSLGICFLGGIFVPQSIMSESVLTIARFVPSYWYMKINNLAASAAPLGDRQLRQFTESLLIQLAFAAAVFAVALVVSKRKRIAR